MEHDEANEGQQQQMLDEQRQREESPWLEMNTEEIAMFLHLNPTYFMTPEAASLWWSGVDREIRRDKEQSIVSREWESWYERSRTSTDEKPGLAMKRSMR